MTPARTKQRYTEDSDGSGFTFRGGLNSTTMLWWSPKWFPAPQLQNHRLHSQVTSDADTSLRLVRAVGKVFQPARQVSAPATNEPSAGSHADFAATSVTVLAISR